MSTSKFLKAKKIVRAERVQLLAFKKFISCPLANVVERSRRTLSSFQFIYAGAESLQSKMLLTTLKAKKQGESYQTVFVSTGESLITGLSSFV